MHHKLAIAEHRDSETLEALTDIEDFEVATRGVFTDYTSAHITVAQYNDIAWWVIVEREPSHMDIVPVVAYLFENEGHARAAAQDEINSGAYGAPENFDWCIA